MNENKKAKIEAIFNNLVDLHKELIDLAKIEYLNLVEADLKALDEVSLKKELIIGEILKKEDERKAILKAVCGFKNKEKITLKALIEKASKTDVQFSKRLRIIHKTLLLLVEQIQSQNKKNHELIESSLNHIQEMKSNILNECSKQTSTYNKKATKDNKTRGARFLSQEA